MPLSFSLKYNCNFNGEVNTTFPVYYYKHVYQKYGQNILQTSICDDNDETSCVF